MPSRTARRTIRSLTLAATLSLGLLAVACQKQHSAAGTSTLNATCPYSGQAADPAVTSTFAGQHVAFCCNGCKAAFDSSSDAEKRRMLAKARGQ
jgi:hypothetical protein